MHVIFTYMFHHNMQWKMQNALLLLETGRLKHYTEYTSSKVKQHLPLYDSKH